MKSRILVPISLGGSPQRCLLNTDLKKSPSPMFVKAMMDNYQERWGRIDEVAFFDGAIPTASQLEVIGSVPWRLSVQPMDLSREKAKWLVERNIQTIELEVLSMVPSVLKENRRGYTPRQIGQMADFFRGKNVRLGAVLSPGMLASNLDSHLSSVDQIIEMGFSFVRIYPVLVFSSTPLERLYREGRYTPLSLAQTVTMIRESLLRLEKHGVEVIRIGRQPKQDGASQPLAGPYHPNLRSLIEFRRFFDKIAVSLAGKERGRYSILVNPKDISLAKGIGGDTIRHLRARLSLEELRVVAESSIERGDILIRRDR